VVGWLVNNELEDTWKEGVVPKLRYYPGIYLKVLKKTTKNLSQTSWYTAEIRTKYLLIESLGCSRYTTLSKELRDLCSPAVTYVGKQTGYTFTNLEIQF
jgi:hypothetical protein